MLLGNFGLLIGTLFLLNIHRAHFQSTVIGVKDQTIQMYSEVILLQKQLLQSLDVIKQDITSVKQQLASLNKTVNVVPHEYRKAYPVFHVSSPKGGYTFTFNGAKAKCIELGATLATLAQLEAAFIQGMDVCACGWLAEGYAAFPMQYPRLWCSGKRGIEKGCTWQSTWDAYCFDRKIAEKRI